MTASHDNNATIVYWHRDLPPLDTRLVEHPHSPRLHLAGYGEARWRLPDGEFICGEFTMTDVVTNVR